VKHCADFLTAEFLVMYISEKMLYADIVRVHAVNRCRLLCCCASRNAQTANAFEDVAYLISDYFSVCLLFVVYSTLTRSVEQEYINYIIAVMHCQFDTKCQKLHSDCHHCLV